MESLVDRNIVEEWISFKCSCGIYFSFCSFFPHVHTDSRHYSRDRTSWPDRPARDPLGQRCTAPLVPDEDCRVWQQLLYFSSNEFDSILCLQMDLSDIVLFLQLPQCKHHQFHHELERRHGFQRSHSQTQVINTKRKDKIPRQNININTKDSLWRHCIVVRREEMKHWASSSKTSFTGNK